MQITLHVRTEPHTEKDDTGAITFDGNKVIGEVKRGDEILYTKSVITADTIESVCGVKDMVGLEIEIWAVQNTGYMPTTDALPA